MVKNILLFGLVLLVSLVVFAPKDRLYYLAEKELETYDAIISQERIEDGFFGVEVANAHLSIKGVEVATVEKMHLSWVLFASSLELRNVVLDASSKGVVPVSEFNLSITHNLSSPKSIGVKLSYQEVSKEAMVRLVDEETLRIEVESIEGMEWLKNYMQEDEKGWYYERTL